MFDAELKLVIALHQFLISSPQMHTGIYSRVLPQNTFRSASNDRPMTRPMT